MFSKLKVADGLLSGLSGPVLEAYSIKFAIPSPSESISGSRLTPVRPSPFPQSAKLGATESSTNAAGTSKSRMTVGLPVSKLIKLKSLVGLP